MVSTDPNVQCKICRPGSNVTGMDAVAVGGNVLGASAQNAVAVGGYFSTAAVKNKAVVTE